MNDLNLLLIAFNVFMAGFGAGALLMARHKRKFYERLRGEKLESTSTSGSIPNTCT